MLEHASEGISTVLDRISAWLGGGEGGPPSSAAP
jgi:hypothetical protein